jgi:hypothetical protein
MTQLAGGEPLSPDTMTQGASTVFPYGLRNAAQIVERHMARCFRTNDEFVGMANYIVESIHDLLVSDSESISDFVSSQGSYHPSRECFMADIVDNPHRKAPRRACHECQQQHLSWGNGTPSHPADRRGAVANTEVPPRQRMDQLRERQQELETA